jgi:hypothetical protein
MNKGREKYLEIEELCKQLIDFELYGDQFGKKFKDEYHFVYIAITSLASSYSNTVDKECQKGDFECQDRKEEVWDYLIDLKSEVKRLIRKAKIETCNRCDLVLYGEYNTEINYCQKCDLIHQEEKRKEIEEINKKDEQERIEREKEDEREEGLRRLNLCINCEKHFHHLENELDSDGRCHECSSNYDEENSTSQNNYNRGIPPSDYDEYDPDFWLNKN